MERDSAKMRDVGPTLFTQVKNGVGVDKIVEEILRAYRASGAAAGGVGGGGASGAGDTTQAAKNKKNKKKKKK